MTFMNSTSPNIFLTYFAGAVVLIGGINFCFEFLER